MEQEILPGLHRILIISKLGQAVADEVPEGVKRIFPFHGPSEGLQITEMIGKTLADERHHGVCHGIWGDARLGGIVRFRGNALRFSAS